MADLGFYTQYRSNITEFLICIINQSNHIILSKEREEEHAPVAINTSGEVTVADIVNMCKLIRKNCVWAVDQSLEPSIVRILRSALEQRSIVSRAFRRIAIGQPGRETEQDNTEHQRFIDPLAEALEIFRGDNQEPDMISQNGVEDFDGSTLDGCSQDGSTPRDSPLASSFRGWSESEGCEESLPTTDVDPLCMRPQRKRKRRGKGKEKRARKARKDAPGAKSSRGFTTKVFLPEVERKNCHIVGESDLPASEYHIAVYAVLHDFVTLRMFVQDLWHDVAFDGLNSVVAATMTLIAISRFRHSFLDAIKEHQNREAYYKMIQTLVKDIEVGQLQTECILFRIQNPNGLPPDAGSQYLDVKELFGFNTYSDLMDFFTDFRTTRNGKPTESMKAQLDKWNPDLDLQRATNQERLSWRRAYTINWLYDLVNLFSSVVTKLNAMQDDQIAYENVDWSTSGYFASNRRLFGIQDFTGDITTFAWSEPYIDVRSMVQPYHVFQLQCIIDSFTVSRGWKVSPLRGHVLSGPPHNFHPLREIEMFLDREDKSNRLAVNGSISLFKHMVEAGSLPGGLCSEVGKHLAKLNLELNLWLGESKHAFKHVSVPASRFLEHNENGLWYFSPYLCGVGLIEPLVLIQRLVIGLWDGFHEMTLAVQLHNALVKTGLLKDQVKIFTVLQELFEELFFPRGVPERGFDHELDAWIATISRATDDGRKPLEDNDDPHFWNRVAATFMKAKSAVMMHHDAAWDFRFIPDHAIMIPSVLYMLRLVNTEVVTSSANGEQFQRLTDLVQRAVAQGRSPAEVVQTAILPFGARNEAEAREAIDLEEDRHASKDPPQDQTRRRRPRDRDILEFLRADIFADVCGRAPMSSLNHVLITSTIAHLFEVIEEKFQAANHWLYTLVYKLCPNPAIGTRRIELCREVLHHDDKVGMQLLAEAFEDIRDTALSYTFWDPSPTDTGVRFRDYSEDIPEDECPVM